MMDHWFALAAAVAFVGCLLVSLVATRRSATADLEEELARMRIQLDMLTLPASSTTGSVSGMEGVLRLVSEGPKTAKQIQSEMGQSREHVARMVKKMSEEGYLKRGEGRPFVYTITQKGSNMLSTGV